MKRRAVSFEIVWTYLGVEYLYSEHASKRDALASFRSGKARSHKLVHGGSLRVDEVREVST